MDAAESCAVYNMEFCVQPAAFSAAQGGILTIILHVNAYAIVCILAHPDRLSVTAALFSGMLLPASWLGCAGSCTDG